ncbi:MAG: hypothetical protein JW757_10070 [Anaerolineales bacterium]|nr:hypothetical protein [Anaerolineales bacterium]
MKDKQFWLIFSILFAFLCNGCSRNGFYQVSFITEGEHVIHSSLSGDLIILGGSVTILKNALLDGDAHLIAGKLRLDGIIQGNVSALGGTLQVGDHAKINGVLNHGGGELQGSQIENAVEKINTGTRIQIPEVSSQQHQTIIGTLGRWILNAFLIGLLALVLNNYLAGQLMRVGETEIKHFWVSIAMGILVGVVGLTLLVLLAYTLVLIPVALLGMFFLGFSIVFGWISGAVFLGKMAAEKWGRAYSKAEVFGSVFVTIFCFSAIGALPYVGGLANILFGTIGLGATFLTRYGFRRFTPETLYDQK